MLGRRHAKSVNGVITYYLWAGQQEIAEYGADWKLLKRYVPGPGLDEIVATVDADGTRHYPFTDRLGSVIGLVNDQGELVEKHAYTAFGIEVTRGENDPIGGIVLGAPRFCASDVVKKNEACVDKVSSDILLETPKTQSEAVDADTLSPDEASVPTDTALLAPLNPLNDTGYAFRFAGRRYDPETGLYYNRARYYSPMLGRFLQPDPSGFSGGLNLYTYAHNDPVNYTDPMGNVPVPALPALTAAGGALLGLGIQAGIDIYRGQTSSLGTYVGAAVSGGIAGAGIMSRNLAAAVGLGAGAAGAGNIVEQGTDFFTGLRQSPSITEVAIATSVGALAGGAAHYLPSVSKDFIPYLPYAQGILTKMEKGLISQISAKTAVKVFGTKTLADHAIPASVAEDFLTNKAIDTFNPPSTSGTNPVMRARK